MGIITIIKIAAALALTALIVGGVWYVRGVFAQAAMAATLQQKLDDSNREAAQLSQIYAAIGQSNAKFDKELTDWQGVKHDIIVNLRGRLAKTPANTNPVCAPSDDDRRLFNDTLQQLTGPVQSGGSTAVPFSSKPSH